MEEGARAKECGQLLEGGKGKATDGPLEPPQGILPADTLISAQ